MTEPTLQGHRILVVEDNALLAMSFNDILKRAGASVVGPTGTMDEAEKIAATETLSGAMLDIKLDAKEVWPVARILITRGVPIMFCTGHFDHASLPPEWSKYPILVKPARPSQIIETLAKVLGPAH
jgi:DNA-binding NtrC family response regulator